MRIFGKNIHGNTVENKSLYSMVEKRIKYKSIKPESQKGIRDEIIKLKQDEKNFPLISDALKLLAKYKTPMASDQIQTQFIRALGQDLYHKILIDGSKQLKDQSPIKDTQEISPKETKINKIIKKAKSDIYPIINSINKKVEKAIEKKGPEKINIDDTIETMVEKRKGEKILSEEDMELFESKIKSYVNNYKHKNQEVSLLNINNDKELYLSNKDNHILSIKPTDLMKLKDNTLKKLNDIKNYLSSDDVEFACKDQLNNKIDTIINQVKINVLFYERKLLLKSLLKSAGTNKDDIVSIFSNVEKKEVGTEKKEFIAKIECIRDILKKNIYYLNENEIKPFVLKLFNSPIELLKKLDSDTKDISDEQQQNLKNAKNSILSRLEDKNIPQEQIDSIKDLIDKGKNTAEIDELISKINIISQIIEMDPTSLNSTDKYVAYHLTLPRDVLNKKYDKLWFKQLSFKGKCIEIARKVKEYIVAKFNNSKLFFSHLFASNNNKFN